MRSSSYLVKAVTIATLMSMAPSAVYAGVFTNTGGNGGSVGFGGGVIVRQDPGTYQYKQFDQATLNAQILQRLDESRRNDKLYLQQVVDELNTAFMNIQAHEFQDLLNASLKNVDPSQPGLIEYRDYMILTNAFVSKENEIAQLIGSIKAVPDALKTSANGGQTADAVVTLQGQLQLDLSPLMNHMNQQFANLEARANALTFTINTPMSGAKTVTGIGGQGLDKADLISPALIQSMTNDLNEKKALAFSTNDKRVVSQISTQTLNLLGTLIDDQGVTEKWRFNDIHSAINQSEIKDLTEAFWMRSMIRMKYGVPVGGIGIEYKKKALNLDRMFSPENLTFNTDLAGTAQLDRSLNMMAQAVKTYDAKATFSGNPLNMVAYVMTRVKGQWNQAQVNMLITQLLVADLQEEKAIISGGGLRQMHAMYQARYQANPAMKQYFHDLANSYEGRSNDAYGDTGIANADSMRGIYAMVEPTLNQVLLKQEQVDRLAGAIKAMTTSAGSKQNSNSDVRSNDL